MDFTTTELRIMDRFERFSLAIMEASRYWHKIASDEMEQYGLKGPHAMYLLTMERFQNGITAARLSGVCGKDKSDVSRAMSLMQKKGLVSRVDVNRTLYRSLLKLTPEGKTAAEHIRKRAQIAVDAAGRDLSEENRDIFYESLESIVNNLRAISKDGLPQK